MSFIQENYINIIILVVLAIIIGIIIKTLISSKKSGTGCTGNCASCQSYCSGKSQLVKTTLIIDGMLCGMCENHINDAIRQNFKVKKVKSSFKNGTTIIISEHRLNDKLLRQTIEKTGYKLIDISFELA